MWRYFLISFLVLPTVLGLPLNASTNTLHVTLDNTINLRKDALNTDVSYVEAKLSWIPRDSYRQNVTAITYTPSARRRGDQVVYRWQTPEQDSLTLHLSANVTATNTYYPVTNPHDFPMQPSSSKQRYVRAQEIIDITPAIRKQAAEIASGENTVYGVTTALATWVHENVNYSLSSLTKQPSKPASWVLRKRKGVCDEITSLFISMTRSLNIPARFVYGKAYSNAIHGWGAHGWAEVYIPGQGWVPFDPTYELYGKLSSTHVKMGTSLDARRPTVTYSASARDITLSPSEVSINVSPLNRSMSEDGLTVNATPALPTIGLNGSNVIKATVGNTDSYYKPVRVRMTPTPSMERKAATILLPPNEAKTVQWTVTPSNLSEGYTYTFPIRVTAGMSAHITSFNATHGGPTVASTDSFSVRERTLACTSRDDVVRVNQTVTISCTPTQDCRNCTTRHERVFTQPGMKNVVIRETRGATVYTGSASVTVVGEPRINMTTRTPPPARVDEQFVVNVVLTPASVTQPRNVTLRLETRQSTHSWQVPSLTEQRKYAISMNAGTLTYDNTFNVSVTYQDRLNRSYRDSTIAHVTVKPESVLGHAQVWLNKFVYFLTSLPANL